MLAALFHRGRDKKARRTTVDRAYVEGAREVVRDSAGPIEQSFYAHQGRPVHKYHHYLPLYDRYFAPYRGRPIKFLEIGVSKGGSLQLWRGFFGDQATIFGIDIEPACAILSGEAGQVRIGSQDDQAFLKAVVAEMGGVDIVLDDGSHLQKHVRATLDILFPMLSDGGLYIVEDLQCAYWSQWGGGYESTGNFFSTVRTIVDDMHHWYHSRGVRNVAVRDNVSGIHIHDAVVVIEKQAITAPRMSVRPQTS